MARGVAEIDANLPNLEPDQPAYSVTVVESSLPYLRNCVKENFRITPVFTMPLARRVLAPEGITIAGQHITKGVSTCSLCLIPAFQPPKPKSLTHNQFQTSVAVCNHSWHHNPTTWGADHNTFDPSRWEDPATAERAKYLMHFGLGGRQCIGKTIATTNIYKLLSTLLREFEFELPDEQERAAVGRGLFKGQIPRLVSVGVSELEAPLMVKARVRRHA
jgi:cytochrome P450